MNKLIGLTGPARSGKDTVADIIITANNERGKHKYRIAFADPIKEMLTQLLQSSGSVLHFNDFAKETTMELYGTSPRQLMQTLGTEWGRNMIHEDLWLNHAKQRINRIRYVDPSATIIITDVRFQNEADYVRQHGELWHVSRDSAQAVRTHSSENGIPFDGKDKIIENNGTLEELQEKVTTLWDSYRN